MNKWREWALLVVENLAIFCGLVLVLVSAVAVVAVQPTWWAAAVGILLAFLGCLLSVVWGFSLVGQVARLV